MNNSVRLHCGELVCEVLPELGGCLAGLWLGADPVLRSTQAVDLQSVHDAASFPLLPFSNRVAHACLLWQGRHHALRQNFAPEPHAIHGVGWERAWALRARAAQQARLSYTHRPDAAWPFAFEAEQLIQLEPRALVACLHIHNRAPHVVPVGLGWHPYFMKRAGSRLVFAATGRWEMGADKLPTHRRSHAGVQACCDALDMDHCFDGWSGVLELHDAQMQVRLTSSLRHLVVYTTPQRNNIALEPVSHVNNVLAVSAQSGVDARDLGLVALPPGATFSCDMRIQMRRTQEPAVYD